MDPVKLTDGLIINIKYMGVLVSSIASSPPSSQSPPPPSSSPLLPSLLSPNG